MLSHIILSTSNFMSCYLPSYLIFSCHLIYILSHLLMSSYLHLISSSHVILSPSSLIFSCHLISILSHLLMSSYLHLISSSHVKLSTSYLIFSCHLIYILSHLLRSSYLHFISSSHVILSTSSLMLSYLLLSHLISSHLVIAAATREDRSESLGGKDPAKNNKTVIRENKVAPIIIKNCKEEFQHVTDFKEPLVYGRIADGMPEHALVRVSNSQLKLVNP